MILTEEEAKTKRCQESFGPLYVTERGGETYVPLFTAVPFAYNTSVATGGPQLPTVASPSHCIGSACMAWRWDKNTQSTCKYPDGTKATHPLTWKGYCGKAGAIEQ